MSALHHYYFCFSLLFAFPLLYTFSNVPRKKISSANTKFLQLFLRTVQIFNDLETDLGQNLHKQKGRSGRRCLYKISNKKMSSNKCSMT